MAQNMATQQMVKNIIDGTTPPKKVKNALLINVNGTPTSYDGSTAQSVTVNIPQDSVKFNAQTLSPSQQEQARTNIGAASATDIATAQSTADTAKTNAANAKTAADNAQSTADTANSTANNAQAQATENATNIANLQEQVDALPTESEVDAKVKAAIDGVIGGAGEAFDTLKEVATWIANDETGTSALVSRVSTNETDIADLKEYAQNHCIMKTVTLSAASWANKLQTFSDSAVKTTSLVKAYPLGNEAEVINNDVYLSTQSEGTLVFACATVPTSAIIYQLEIYNVTSLS